MRDRAPGRVTREHCAQLCDEKPTCVAFVTSPPGNCWMKQWCDGSQLMDNPERMTCLKLGMCIHIYQLYLKKKFAVIDFTCHLRTKIVCLHNKLYSLNGE